MTPEVIGPLLAAIALAIATITVLSPPGTGRAGDGPRVRARFDGGVEHGCHRIDSHAGDSTATSKQDVDDSKRARKTKPRRAGECRTASAGKTNTQSTHVSSFHLTGNAPIRRRPGDPETYPNTCPLCENAGDKAPTCC